MPFQRSLASSISPDADQADTSCPPLDHGILNFHSDPDRVMHPKPSPIHAESNSWITEEVGYFEPDLTEEDHIRYVNGVMHFSHVLAFVNNLRAIAVFKTEDTMRCNLHACLRGLSREWFISELSHQDRESLRELPFEDGWCRRLLGRFSPSKYATLVEGYGKIDTSKSYPNHVAWSHILLRRLQCNSKYTNASTHEQLVVLYELLDPDLRKRLAPPLPEATIEEFMNNLEDIYLELYYEDSFKRDDEATEAGKSFTWIPSEIGYFAPDQTLTHHVHRENGILYFRDVYAFVNYMRVIAETTQETVIRANLHLCLRDKALEWWVAELTSQQRQILRSKHLEDGWFHTLQVRFHPDEEVADEQLYETKYGWDAVKAEYPAAVWAHTMLRHHQALKPARLSAELLDIWNAFDPELQEDLEKPSEDTILADFMASVDRCYNKWRWLVMTDRK